MHIEADKILVIVCFSYVGCLLAVLWLHKTRQWKIARYILALLILLLAVAFMSLGLGIVDTWLSGGYANTASDLSAVVAVIGIGAGLSGMTIAFFAVRLVTSPWRQKRMARLTERNG